MLSAAVAKIEGNLTERQLVVHQQLLDLLCFLQNKELLHRNALHAGKQLTDGRVILKNMLPYKFSKAKMLLNMARLHFLNNEVFNLLDQLRFLVVQKLKTDLL